ncbi:MAG: hypothetical protein LBL62_11900 [Planctomycetaceae bacterium]|nr:hypothetical protein [Planctomycetaceae bacterium]
MQLRQDVVRAVRNGQSLRAVSGDLAFRFRLYSLAVLNFVRFSDMKVFCQQCIQRR